MTWSTEELSRASEEELVRWADQGVPTLRQLHSIKELALRASRDPLLLPCALEQIRPRLGLETRVAGIPAGYLGAKVLFEAGGRARASLLAAVATIDPVEREDLLRWLQPGDAPPHRTSPILIEQELIFDSFVRANALEGAVQSILDVSPAEMTSDVEQLNGVPEGVAFVGLSLANWATLEQRRGELSDMLRTTIYWPPPERLGPLGPDLRIAVHPGGTIELVTARYNPDGFDVAPFTVEEEGQ